MGELTKTDNAGKNSPGPVYAFSDNIKYDNVSILIYFPTTLNFIEANNLNKINECIN